jgi:hypothetical protein
MWKVDTRPTSASGLQKHLPNFNLFIFDNFRRLLIMVYGGSLSCLLRIREPKFRIFCFAPSVWTYLKCLIFLEGSKFDTTQSLIQNLVTFLKYVKSYQTTLHKICDVFTTFNLRTFYLWWQ